MKIMDSEDILRGLMRWVEIDTPTGSVETIGHLIDLIEQEFDPLGPQIDRIKGRDGMGDHLVIRFPGGGGPGVLLSSHIDTVCVPGTVAARRVGPKQYGPGIADMKGGGYLALCAIRNIVSVGIALPGPVTLIYNSDEEIGSPTSSHLIQAEAKRHGCALVPEPARGDEAITFRKGRAKYMLEFQGQEAHAGSAFADGHSAISAMARSILALDAMTDLSMGTTINVGRIRGGTEPNVVAAYAACDVDVRFSEDANGTQVETAIRALQAHEPQVTITVSGEIEKPTLARTAANLEMLMTAKVINRTLGVDLIETSSGGGSDGNFTAAIGIPTLDGLGAIGGNWHSPQEHILVEPLARREMLLRQLILKYAGTAPQGA